MAIKAQVAEFQTPVSVVIAAPPDQKEAHTSAIKMRMIPKMTRTASLSHVPASQTLQGRAAIPNALMKFYGTLVQNILVSRH